MGDGGWGYNGDREGAAMEISKNEFCKREKPLYAAFHFRKFQNFGLEGGGVGEKEGDR